MIITKSPPSPLVNRVEALALEPTDALAKVRAWLDAPPSEWALFLLGPTGIGKSQAAALAWRVTPGAVWLRARELQTLAWEARSTLIGWAKSAALLVVEELGSENQASEAALLDVLEHRGESFRSTIVIGNLTRAEVTRRYGDRLADRLRPTRRWFFELGGESLRGRTEPMLERPDRPWLAGVPHDEQDAFERRVYRVGLDVAQREREEALAEARAASAAEPVDWSLVASFGRRLRPPVDESEQ